jgi:hypothetical protein
MTYSVMAITFELETIVVYNKDVDGISPESCNDSVFIPEYVFGDNELLEDMEALDDWMKVNPYGYLPDWTWREDAETIEAFLDAAFRDLD